MILDPWGIVTRSSDSSEFRDVVFEDVVFDHNIAYLILKLYFTLWGHITIIIKHHILKHHILELPRLRDS